MARVRSSSMSGSMLSDLQQLDAVLPITALRAQLLELRGEVGIIEVEVLLRPKPAISGVGVDGEIADEQRRPDVEPERGQK